MAEEEEDLVVAEEEDLVVDEEDSVEDEEDLVDEEEETEVEEEDLEAVEVAVEDSDPLVVTVASAVEVVDVAHRGVVEEEVAASEEANQ